MKKIILSILVFTSVVSYAQQPDIEWANDWGGSGNEFAFGTISDSIGNVYIASSFEGTVDFDPSTNVVNLTSVTANKADISIHKLDPNGNLVWAKSIGGTGTDYGRRITLDKGGNIYVTGEFSDTVDFNSGSGIFNLISNGALDIFVLKLNNNGDFVWAKSIEGNDTKQALAIDVDGFDNVYTLGVYSQVSDFNPAVGVFNLTSNGFFDVFIQKLDVNGNFVWAKSIGGKGYDYSYSLILDENNDILLTGGYRDTVDFDPGIGTTNLISNGNYDVFIQKLDDNGDLVWVKSIGSTASDIGISITKGKSGSIYLGGNFNGTADFDPGSGVVNLTSNGFADFFIQKLDDNGDFIWAKSIGGDQNDEISSIACDLDDNIYLVGNYKDTVDFDPNIGVTNSISNGEYDLYVQKLDSSGNLVWVETYGGLGYELAKTVVLDQLGNVYAAGSFQDTVSLDSLNSPLISNGGYDGFVIKFSQNTSVGMSENILTNNLTLYPNPTHGNFNVDLGKTFKQVNIQIFDLSGRVVFEQSIENKQIVSLNFDAPQGIYFVRINTGENQSTIKLIKK